MKYAIVAIWFAVGSLASCGAKETLDDFKARCVAAGGTAVDAGDGFYKCIGADGQLVYIPAK